MCAQTVTDEFSLFRKQFQPRPDYTFKWLARKSDEATRDAERQVGLAELTDFHFKADSLIQRLATLIDTLRPSPIQEYYTALQITALRAKHRALTVKGILAHREKDKDEKEQLLSQAAEVRLQGVGLVHTLEVDYKYDTAYLYDQRYSHTSYPHGYLFAPHTLHFWKREEEQCRKNRWNYQFMSIWKVGRIIGL
jgi:hypothetical protein